MSDVIKKALISGGFKPKRQLPSVNMSKTRTGKVKWFDIRKGFGFIVDDETGEEIFVHFQKISAGRTYTGMEEYDTVTYSVQEDIEKNKRQAVNVIVTGHIQKERSGDKADVESDKVTKPKRVAKKKIQVDEDSEEE